MEWWSVFGQLAVAHLLAVASPGPDFFLVTRLTLAGGRRAGVAASAGIALGVLVWIAACLLGVAVLLKTQPLLFTGLKWVGAAYLVYLGWGALRSAAPREGATDSSAEAGERPSATAVATEGFRAGLLCNLFNPKAGLFFLFLFTVVLPPDSPGWLLWLSGGWMLLANFAWFALVAWTVGLPTVQRWLRPGLVWVNRALGVVLWLLAAQLALG